jgi:hypothetical protein
MNGVDEPEIVIGQQKAIRPGTQDAARTSVNNGLPVNDSQKARDQIMRHSIGRRESRDAIACADVRMAGAVQSDKEAIAQYLIVVSEILEA